ncbi:YjzC family protein [Peribacillus sp. SCS-155]|uniref:YjzC family protein n=1 Tax=Peribacillus sedimenti TaxID=3115297 RepID=UPI0039063CF3
MAQNNRFKPGQKAPNNGIYVEIGETGSMVVEPRMAKLRAGQRFPETANDDRVWRRVKTP